MKDTIASVLPEIIALRHELHQHPEIRFEEKWTSARIARFLDEAGIPYTQGHAKGTGIVAQIEGHGDKTVALRADMDALEIQEDTGLPYASQIPERMHACGHDGHMACLCGTAKVLNAQRESLGGKVKLIFQPAEEQAAGGRFIVEEGLLDDVQAVFALHGWPSLPVGAVGIKSGPAMASADFFRIDIAGKGCHGGDPAAGIDPVVVASHITTGLQNIASREINPWDPVVVTVARIQAGTTSNVIPENAFIEGTFRALDEKVRHKIFDALERIAENTARAHRATAEVSFLGHPYPPLHNDEAMSLFARDTIVDAFGKDNLAEPEHPAMGAEDFAFYLQKTPGAFLFLGVNPRDDEAHPPLHSPHFNFNDDALATGIELMSRLALGFLKRA